MDSQLFDDSEEARVYQRAFNGARQLGYTAGEASVAGETARVNWQKGFAEGYCIKLGLKHARHFRLNRQSIFPFPIPQGKL